jgi:hypothetical protein
VVCIIVGVTSVIIVTACSCILIAVIINPGIVVTS